MKLKWLATLTLATTLAFAQGPGAPPTPPSPEALKTALGLTDAQVTALDQLQQSKRTQIEPLMQQMMTQRTALRDAMQKATPDAAAIAAILVQIQALQKQIQAVDASFVTQSVATLSADQKTKLTTLQNAQKVMDAVHQAEMLNLLTRPEGGPGEPGALGGPGGPGLLGGPGAAPAGVPPPFASSFAAHSR